MSLSAWSRHSLHILYVLSLRREHRTLNLFPTRRSSDLVRNIRALNGRFNTSITHAYSIVIGSKHITLNATDNNTVGMGEDRKSGSAGMPRPISYAVFCLKKKNGPATIQSPGYAQTPREVRSVAGQ